MKNVTVRLEKYLFNQSRGSVGTGGMLHPFLKKKKKKKKGEKRGGGGGRKEKARKKKGRGTAASWSSPLSGAIESPRMALNSQKAYCAGDKKSPFFYNNF